MERGAIRALRLLIVAGARPNFIMPVVFPVHPRTQKGLKECGVAAAGSAGVKVLEPVGYHDSLCVAEHARFIVTDSGGLREESTFFGSSCLTLRANTERPVTISIGSNRLATVSRLVPDIGEVLRSSERSGSAPPLWDGHAAERVFDVIRKASART